MATTLIFDLGGVVLNWQPVELLRFHLPHRLPSVDAARQLAGTFFESFRPGSDWAEFDRGMLAIDEVARRIARRTALTFDEVLSVMKGIPQHLQLRVDSAALLKELHRGGHRLVYLSNMPEPYIEHAQRQLDSLAVFESGIYSSDVRLVKPQNEIYLLATQRFKAAAADCVFFDDSAANIDAARLHGWQAFRFSDATAARLVLMELGMLPACSGESAPRARRALG